MSGLVSRALVKEAVVGPRAGVRARLAAVALAALIFLALYLVLNIRGDWQFAVTRRLLVVGAVVLAAAATGGATVIFQTLTHNHILTPSVIGLDSLYVLMQTLVVFALGAASPAWTDATVHFLLSTALLVLFAGLLYQRLFRSERHNVYVVLLIGLIAGTFFQSVASFLQMILDPNEFLIAQSRLFATFNNVRAPALALAAGALALAALYAAPYCKYLDVLGLGREHAINLGVDYNRVVRRLWMVIAGLVSVSTALVGPVTFLGLLVANLAYQLFTTHRHTILIPGAAALGVAALVAAMFAVERVFSFTTTVSVVINFVGSLYFLYIVLKESQR